MNTEAKVGAFTIGGVILLMAVYVFLTNFQFGGDKRYDLNIQFEQVIGLTPGNDVAYAGVNVGSISAIEPAGPNILVRVKINQGVKIPRKSRISITSSGVMGQKFINIQPDENCDMSDCYQPGDYIDGASEAGISSLMEGLNGAMVQVQALLGSMNDVLGNDDTKKALREISLNMRDVTGNLSVLSATLADMAVTNQGDIRQMAVNLRTMTGSLMRAADGVEQIVTTFNGDGQTGANLKLAIKNLSDTSKRIDHMAASLEGVVTDPQVADDLKNTLHNVRNVTQRADKMMSKVSNIKVSPGVETMYSGADGKWMTNADVSVYTSPYSFARLGINDIGEGNTLDLQGGMRFGSVGGRAGITESKAGLGLDLYGSDKLKLSLDAYDPNDFRLKSRLQYEIAKNTFLFTQINDINRSSRRATYFGLRHSF